jgi:hypothetical protein
MNNRNNFPDNMPLWQGIEQDYNDRTAPAEGNIPFAPELGGPAPQAEVMPNNFMPAAQQEAIDQAAPMTKADQDSEFGAGVVESGQISQDDFNTARGNMPANYDQLIQDEANQFGETPNNTVVGSIPDNRTPQEKMLEEFKAMREQDQKALEDARSMDRKMKIGGAIGDSLATIINARGQMNVKAQGGVREGAGLGKMAEAFANTPNVESDIKSRRDDLMAQYKALKGSGGAMTPYQELALQLQRERLGLQDRSEEGKSERARANLELKKVGMDRPSDKQTEGLDAYAQARQSLARVKELKKDIDTGPLADLRNAAATKVGINDPNVTALRTEILDTLASKIKALSGTAANEAEVKRLAVTLPQMNDNDTVFNRQVEDALTRLNEAEQIRIKSLEKQGKNVENFKAPETSTQDPKIKKYADDHGLDYSKAETILRNRGYNG